MPALRHALPVPTFTTSHLSVGRRHVAPRRLTIAAPIWLPSKPSDSIHALLRLKLSTAGPCCWQPQQSLNPPPPRPPTPGWCGLWVGMGLCCGRHCVDVAPPGSPAAVPRAHARRTALGHGICWQFFWLLRAGCSAGACCLAPGGDDQKPCISHGCMIAIGFDHSPPPPPTAPMRGSIAPFPVAVGHRVWCPSAQLTRSNQWLLPVSSFRPLVVCSQIAAAWMGTTTAGDRIR